jgi:hypothetical protein
MRQQQQNQAGSSMPMGSAPSMLSAANMSSAPAMVAPTIQRAPDHSSMMDESNAPQEFSRPAEMSSHPTAMLESLLAGIASSQNVTPQAPQSAQLATRYDASGNVVIGQIGNLLDSVVTLANSARAHFQQGQHNDSSICLSDLQRALAQIGELGSKSLATVRAEQTTATASVPPSERPLPEESPTVKKRPMRAAEDEVQPFKTLRARDGTPIQPPAPPPSAPPFMQGDDSLSQHLFRHPPPDPPQSAPPMLHAASAPDVMEAIVATGSQPSSSATSQVNSPIASTQARMTAAQLVGDSPADSAMNFRFPAQPLHAPKQRSNLGPGGPATDATFSVTPRVASTASLPATQSGAVQMSPGPRDASAMSASTNHITSTAESQLASSTTTPEIPRDLRLSQMGREAFQPQPNENWSDDEDSYEQDDEDDQDDNGGWDHDESGHSSMIQFAAQEDPTQPRPPSDPALAMESSLRLNLGNAGDAVNGGVIVGGTGVGEDKEPATSLQIGPELKQKLDSIFWSYLNMLCSNREYMLERFDRERRLTISIHISGRKGSSWRCCPSESDA